MNIIKEGRSPYNTVSVKFNCRHCETEFECDCDERFVNYYLETQDPFKKHPDNKRVPYWVYYCPVCEKKCLTKK